jgi:hypothetical protein
MHDIEPYFKWRDDYIASKDKRSPFYGQTYNEFQYTNKIYNYFIHPQWDQMGSPTLYLKLLFADYDHEYCIIELIGEWNDCIHNDIMYLKREIADILIHHKINKFIIFCDHVLNYHADDDCYYEEWYDDVKDEDGWICFINVREHVLQEMNSIRLKNYINLGEEFNDIQWRNHKPKDIYKSLKALI